MSDALKTLFHPFYTGVLDPPGSGRVLFLDAEPDFRLPDGFSADLELVQGFRPQFLKLANAGWAVAPTPEGQGYDAALVLAGRHRQRNEAWVSEALRRAKPDSLIVVAGSKADGIASLRKQVASTLPIEDSLSKFHGQVFWFRRRDVDAALEALSAAPTVIDARFRTAPGSFSQDRVDIGSRLLAECLPADTRGLAADFCAGWGYLSVMLAGRPNALSGIDLYEADYESLQAARDNMARLAPGMPARFFWQDLAAEPVAERYDLVVMNPPFHQGRAAEPDIGRRMIAAAARALKPGGWLYMVANRGLPYEDALKANFREIGELRVEAGFRVTAARK